MATASPKPTFLQRHPRLGKWIFKETNSRFTEDRKAQADKIIASYPDKIPVICEPADNSELTLDRTK